MQHIPSAPLTSDCRGSVDIEPSSGSSCTQIAVLRLRKEFFNRIESNGEEARLPTRTDFGFGLHEWQVQLSRQREEHH